MPYGVVSAVIEREADVRGPSASVVNETERRQRVSDRAYLLFLSRGDEGDALGDWLEAERQIQREIDGILE